MTRSWSLALCELGLLASLVVACSSGSGTSPADTGVDSFDAAGEGQGEAASDATTDGASDTTTEGAPDALTDAADSTLSETGDAPGDSGITDSTIGPGDALAQGDAVDETSSEASADSPYDATVDGAPDALRVPEAGNGPRTLASLTVSTGSLNPPFDPTTTDYQISSLNDVYPVTVTATTLDGGSALTINGADASSGVPSTFTLSRGADIAVSAGGLTYTVHYMPADMPGFEVATTSDAGTEDLLLNASLKYQLIVDRSGAVRYYRSFGTQEVLDFQPFTLPDGSVEYASLVGSTALIGWIEGAEHVIDSHFNDVGDFQLVAGDAEAALPAEAHDFILLDNDHYVAMAYVKRTVDLSGLNASYSSSAPVVHAVLQEVVAGASVFEWDSRNVPSLYGDSVYGNGFQTGTTSDYLHLNSMCIDPSDGNFVLSFRNTCSVVKVDRHTGQTLWTLGGKSDQFGLTATQLFKFQHYVRVQPDGSIWVFDNGIPGTQTRILKYVLNETSKTLVSFTDLYDEPSSQPQSGIMGSYAPMSPTRAIYGWGDWFSGKPGPDVTEVSSGSVVWSFAFADASDFSYRALPIPPL
jgi:hypothetical protein